MTPDPNDWGRDLEAGNTNHELLDLAARLRRERPAAPVADEQFARDLRARLTRRTPDRVSVRFALIGGLVTAAAGLAMIWLAAAPAPGPSPSEGDEGLTPVPTALCLYGWGNGDAYPPPTVPGMAEQPDTLATQALIFARDYPGTTLLSEATVAANATLYHSSQGRAAATYVAAHATRCAALPADQRATERALAEETWMVQEATNAQAAHLAASQTQMVERDWTATATASPPPTDTPSPTPTPILPPTATPNAAPITTLPEGLRYFSQGSLWVVEDSGPVIADPAPAYAQLDPSGQFGLLLRDEDLWLVTVADGQLRNLTQSPDRREIDARWWPSRPGVVAVVSVLAGTDQVAEGLRELALLTISDGTTQVIVASDTIFVDFALSPDGRSVAYHQYPDWVVLDTLEGNQRALTPASVLEPPAQGFGLNPVFSPDGRWLALSLIIIGQTEENNGQGLWLTDLQTGDSRLSTTWPRVNEGRGLAPYPSFWSPDGQWVLVFNERDYQLGYRPIRIADGSIGDLIPGRVHSFSPDGRLVVVQNLREVNGTDPVPPRYSLWATEPWTALGMLALPDDATVLDWVQPP